MRRILLAAVAAAPALFSGIAMAQGMGNQPRFDREDPSANLSAAPTGLPNGPGSLPAWDYRPSAYAPQWSVNPGVLNSQTSNPGFFDHSHGRP